jgi:hypothetical protein
MYHATCIPLGAVTTTTPARDGADTRGDHDDVFGDHDDVFGDHDDARAGGVSR